MFLFPVAMHWLHQKNFKQLIVSPLRPLFLSKVSKGNCSIKGLLLLKVHAVRRLCHTDDAYHEAWTGSRENNKKKARRSSVTENENDRLVNVLNATLLLQIIPFYYSYSDMCSL